MTDYTPRYRFVLLRHGQRDWRTNYNDAMSLIDQYLGGPAIYGYSLPLTELVEDDSTVGIVINKVAGENLSFCDIIYFNSDGKVYKADASDANKFPAQGMATADALADSEVDILLYGVVRKGDWGWNIGKALYLNTSAGGMTQTYPTAPDQCIQILGYCHPEPHSVLFRPDVTYLQHR